MSNLQKRSIAAGVSCERRRVLGGLLVGATAGAIWPGGALAGGGDSIVQPQVPDDAAFIARAFKMRNLAKALGDQPYGAVVVRDNLIIGLSHSRVVSEQDPTAHAELAAIRDAARRSGNRDLSGAVLYSSSRPCPMCEAAAYWANIKEMKYGHNVASAGLPRLCS
ncbi:MAG: nucleoside deaminase [Aestuariivirgaceae bacterium]